MEELIMNIVRPLVTNPEAVAVNMVRKGDMYVYELHVDPADMGRVIGRQGRIAKAIRTVVKAGALQKNQKVAVDIVEEAAVWKK